jgi:hypothetical protein
MKPKTSVWAPRTKVPTMKPHVKPRPAMGGPKMAGSHEGMYVTFITGAQSGADSMGDRRVCEQTGKVCYRGPNEARQAHRHAHYRIRVYRCDWCPAWHVTNGEKANRQSSRGDWTQEQQWQHGTNDTRRQRSRRRERSSIRKC